MTDKIDTEELLQIAEPGRKERIKIFKRENTLVVEDVYDKSGNPYGDQIVWTVYASEEGEMDKFYEELQNFFNKMERKTAVFYDDINPEKDLFPRIHILSDNGSNFTANEVEVLGEKGYVGAITGQGRELSSRAFDLLVFLLGRFAEQKHIAAMDPQFFAKCREKMGQIANALGSDLTEGGK
ncbi:hypothetical protein AKJ41_03230 [candidate division MSBL1 archaeon SCGC-AAA259O05]|uniref:Uncharacterized protein n=1 Tax=candidate division MSBL1 archaeon SCGC-AAA259O05 TaxID=1698271 RepID=A0A133V3G6_9EURY|nr:hypothetical protein AKJ41_03230 [candidate division MSBL1 archaeon SCGC-AAA259O05]